MKKIGELLEQFRSARPPESKAFDRAAYLAGDLFRVGDIVESARGDAEVLYLGTNYVTLIKDGKTFREWAEAVQLKETPENVKAKPRIYRETISFKGYKTKNLSRDLAESLKKTNVTPTDWFAYYNCLVACDSLLGASKEDIKENFNKYKNDYNRAMRYLDKYGIATEEFSTVEAILIEEYMRIKGYEPRVGGKSK